MHLVPGPTHKGPLHRNAQFTPPPKHLMCKTRSKAQEGAHDPARRQGGGEHRAAPTLSTAYLPTERAASQQPQPAGRGPRGSSTRAVSGSLPTHWCTHTSSRGPTRAHRCQAAAGPLFRCRPGPGCQGSWEGRARLLEPPVTAGGDAGRAAWGEGCRVTGLGVGSESVPRVLAPARGTHFPEVPLLSLDSAPRAWARGRRAGLGGLLGPGDAALASGHSPSERCVLDALCPVRTGTPRRARGYSVAWLVNGVTRVRGFYYPSGLLGHKTRSASHTQPKPLITPRTRGSPQKSPKPVTVPARHRSKFLPRRKIPRGSEVMHVPDRGPAARCSETGAQLERPWGNGNESQGRRRALSGSPETPPPDSTGFGGTP